MTETLTITELEVGLDSEACCEMKWRVEQYGMPRELQTPCEQPGEFFVRASCGCSGLVCEAHGRWARTVISQHRQVACCNRCGTKPITLVRLVKL